MSAHSPNKMYDTDPVWHAQLFIFVALVLQLLLPDNLVAGPHFVLPALEAVLLVILVFTTPKAPIFRSLARRVNAVTLSALISLANIYSLVRVTQLLLEGGGVANGHQLIIASLNIYLTNIIIFGLWYWEIDAGGPGNRRRAEAHEHDLLFTQMASPQWRLMGWEPTFFDYLYVSTTNATAFSPTDTLPLTRRVKLLMAVQSVVSLVTIALIAARAVNILG